MLDSTMILSAQYQKKKKTPLTPKAIIQTEKMWRYEKGAGDKNYSEATFSCSLCPQSIEARENLGYRAWGEKWQWKKQTEGEATAWRICPVWSLLYAKSTAPFWEQFVQSRDGEEEKWRRIKRDGRAVQLEGNLSAPQGSEKLLASRISGWFCKDWGKSGRSSKAVEGESGTAKIHHNRGSHEWNSNPLHSH